MSVDKSKVCHPFNTEYAKKYIGCKGWFSNIPYFEFDVEPSKLKKIYDTLDGNYRMFDGYYYNYFYPAEEPAEYRPYETVEEVMPYVGRVMVSKDKISCRLLDIVFMEVDGCLTIGGVLAKYWFDGYTFADGSPVGVNK